MEGSECIWMAGGFDDGLDVRSERDEPKTYFSDLQNSTLCPIPFLSCWGGGRMEWVGMVGGGLLKFSLAFMRLCICCAHGCSPQGIGCCPQDNRLFLHCGHHVSSLDCHRKVPQSEHVKKKNFLKVLENRSLK